MMRFSLLVTFAVLVAACGHITHGANVEAGARGGASVAFGSAKTTNIGSTTADRTEDVMAQVFGGYTFKWESGRALSLNLALQYHSLPFSDLATDREPAQLWVGYLDTYGQLVSGPVDFGVGFLLGPMEPYFELGHRFEIAGVPTDLSAGLRLGLVPEGQSRLITPFLMVSAVVGNSIRVGFVSEFAWAPDSYGVTLCDECFTQPQDLRNELTIGLMVQLP
jgi:hypothetical protein